MGFAEYATNEQPTRNVRAAAQPPLLFLAVNSMPEDQDKSFRPTTWIGPTEPDPLTYEAVHDLAIALDELDCANKQCRAEPSFDNVVDACRKCRTAFAEFVRELGLAGTACDPNRLESLLAECHAAVATALSGICKPHEIDLTRGYLRHIENRIHLARTFRIEGDIGYDREIKKLLDEAEANIAMA